MSKHKKVNTPNNLANKNVRKSNTEASAPVCWQFSLMDFSGSFSCSDITRDEWNLILSKMRLWETTA